MAVAGSTRSLSPILSGACADRALAALGGVAAHLLALRADEIGNESVGGGWAGLALVHDYLERWFPREGHAEARDALLARAVEAASTNESLSLFRGVTGIAWVLDHVQGRGAGDPSAAVESALLDVVAERPYAGALDLVDGLAGVGLFALERQRSRGGGELLVEVTERLAELAVPSPLGSAWPTETDGSKPARFDLGVAHGQLGPIAVLAAAVGRGLGRHVVERTLDEAVSFLLAHELPPRAAQFPAWVEPGLEQRPARNAWCYGAAGIGAVLLRAARDVGEPRWEREALRIARSAATRSTDESGVLDAPLCHGAAGLGHVFHRMYGETGDPVFVEAARAWLARALDLRTVAGGEGDFPFALGGTSGPTFRAVPGLLEGMGGVALALGTAVFGGDAGWDRVFLLY